VNLRRELRLRERQHHEARKLLAKRDLLAAGPPIGRRKRRCKRWRSASESAHRSHRPTRTDLVGVS
jgi:hypothetical protein